MQRHNAITVNLMISLQPHSPDRDRLAVADVPGDFLEDKALRLDFD